MCFQTGHQKSDSEPQDKKEEPKEEEKRGKLQFTLDYNFTDSAVWTKF